MTGTMVGTYRLEELLGDGGLGVRERGEERGLAAVGRPEEDDLRRALRVHLDGVPVPGGPRLLLVPEARQAPLEVRLHLLGPLVLGDRGEHLLEGDTPLVEGVGGLEPRLGRPVLGGEVRRHPPRL